MRTIRFFSSYVVLEYEGTDEDLIFSFSPSEPNRLQVEFSSPQNYEKNWGQSQVMNIEAIFGIYNLLSGPFIALVLESEARVLGHEK